MSEQVQEHIVLDDPAVLLVSGSKGERDLDRDYVKKLANAIGEVFNKHQVAKMRCVGPAALNNALKSFIIAKNSAEKNGVELVLKADFVTVNFSGVDKTGILMEVIKR